MKTTLLSILVLTLVSCDASTKEFIGSSWKVTELKTNGTVVKVTSDVILKVNSETDFTLKLDTNNCFGTYAITGKDKIKLEGLACTEMCCDSDFSKAVLNGLSKVSKISLNKNRVTLSSDEVEIKFERYEILSNAKLKMMNTDGKFTKNGRGSTETTTNVGKFENPNKTQSTTDAAPKGEYIELYKSPCKGNCEEFTMKFYEDGTVYYTGKFNATVQGKHSVTLTASKSKSLFKEFEQSNFMSFQEKYDNERIMDLQNTYLTYKGKKIHIRDKYSAPKELKELLEKLEVQAKEALDKLKKR